MTPGCPGTTGEIITVFFLSRRFMFLDACPWIHRIMLLKAVRSHDNIELLYVYVARESFTTTPRSMSLISGIKENESLHKADITDAFRLNLHQHYMFTT